MKKLLVFVVTALIFIGNNGLTLYAAQFENDSYILTNPYMKMNVGVRQILNGDMDGDHEYIDAISIEIIDGVNCVKINDIAGRSQHSNQYEIFWVAEDINGDTYLLQVATLGTADITTFGSENAILLMPSNPYQGQNFAQIGTEYLTIVETDVTVSLPNSGLGPFTNCLKIKESEDGDIWYSSRDVVSFLGMVKKEYNRGQYEGWELKEVVMGGLEASIDSMFTQEQLDQAVLTEKEKWDQNGDGKYGLPEAIKALQVTSGTDQE